MSEVERDAGGDRYTLAIGDDLAVAEYRIEGGVVVFTHTLVPPVLEGQGAGTRLIAGALADVRARGLRIMPVCSFVAAYLERHPDQRDLLADGAG